MLQDMVYMCSPLLLVQHTSSCCCRSRRWTLWSEQLLCVSRLLQMDTLKQKGVEKVVCVSAADPEEVAKATAGLEADKVGGNPLGCCCCSCIGQVLLLAAPDSVMRTARPAATFTYMPLQSLQALHDDPLP